MNDSWTWLNEVVQNIMGVAVVGTYLYLTIVGRDTPAILETFAAAILIFFGFKVYKASRNGAVK